MEEKECILKPLPRHHFEPFKWSHVLATQEVCMNEINPTHFCDEKGYAITPMYILSVTWEEPKEEANISQAHKYSLSCKRRQFSQKSLVMKFID